MPSITIYFSFLISLTLISSAFAQTPNVQFNQVINLNGDMQLNSLTFPDNSKIETFSQTQHQILVNQNTSPLTANHVVGSTGQPFVQLSQNAMTIETNNATDLVGAQIEMKIDPNVLSQNGITADNTFVAKLSPDRQAWIVVEGMKSVNTTDNTVRMIKMNSIDGEYMAIGRKTVETSNVLQPFGQSAQQSINITGSGIQEVEFQDGFRMAVMATQPMTINADVVNGVSTSMLTSGEMTANNYRYLVTSNLGGVNPSLNQMMTVVQLPINAQRIMDMAIRSGAGPNSTVTLAIAQRVVIPSPGGAVGNLSPRPQRRQDAANSTTEVTTPSNSTGTATPDEVTNSTSTAAIAAPTPAASNQASNPAATQLLLAPTFSTISSPTVIDAANGRIAAAVSQVDGEFIITMQMGAVGVVGGGASGAGGALSGTQSAAGTTMTMGELTSMMKNQANGGVMPVWEMMSVLKAQLGVTEPGVVQRRRARL